MDIERRVLQLERQNLLLKVIACPILILAAAGSLMGAASFNQDRGELLKITRIQLVNANGDEVAVIDAKGINYKNKESQLTVEKILARANIEVNPQPENNKRYVEMGVDPDGHKCYLDMGNSGHTRFLVLVDKGSSNSNFK